MRRSNQYSLTEPLPIVGCEVLIEGAVQRPSLLRHLPAAVITAEIGAATRHPARVDDDAPIDQGEPVQFRAGFDLTAPDAGAKRLSPRQRYFPLPRAGEGQGGGRLLPPRA
jgi:hypothetical protein